MRLGTSGRNAKPNKVIYKDNVLYVKYGCSNVSGNIIAKVTQINNFNINTMNLNKIQDKIAIVFNNLEHKEDTENANLLAEVLDDIKALSITDISKRVFVIRDTSGELIKLCATKETAKKELEKYKNQHNYADFYIDDETLY